MSLCDVKPCHKSKNSEMENHADKPSYDIFEWFPIGVCQDIFGYLDGKDVIQASAVNKEWNKLCAESQQAKKLKLVLDQVLNNEDVELLKNSKRKYENIVIACIRIICYFSRVMSSFLANGGPWKSVKLYHGWMNPKEWSEFFGIIEQSVEELAVFGPNSGFDLVNVDFNWTFPCLRVLEGDHYTSKLCKMFVHCTSLVKFYWPSDFLTNNLTILTILHNNHNLKDLNVSVHGALLEHSIDFKFKLDKLLIDRSSDDDALYALLETQAQTLQSLEIHANFDRTSLELILRMPKLSSFTNFSDYVIAALRNNFAHPLPVNTTISSLEFKYNGQDLRHQETFQALIRSLTNLQHFKCHDIGEEEFDFLAREVPALESFEAEILQISRFPRGDLFPNLKMFKVKRFLGSLLEPAGDSNFALLARKAMRES